MQCLDLKSNNCSILWDKATLNGSKLNFKLKNSALFMAGYFVLFKIVTVFDRTGSAFFTVFDQFDFNFNSAKLLVDNDDGLRHLLDHFQTNKLSHSLTRDLFHYSSKSKIGQKQAKIWYCTQLINFMINFYWKWLNYAAKPKYSTQKIPFMLHKFR